MAKKQNPNIVTPEFRLAFPSLFEPRDYNGKVTYCLTMLFDKSVDITEIKKLAVQAAKAKWPGLTKEEMQDKDKFYWPWSDGDLKDYDGFAGNIAVRADRAASIDPPAVVDQKRNPIIDANKVYSGCWCRANVDAYAWENSGKRGVKLGLIAVQFVRNDEPFGDGGGLKRAQNVFTDVAGGSEDAENYEDAPEVDELGGI